MKIYVTCDDDLALVLWGEENDSGFVLHIGETTLDGEIAGRPAHDTAGLGVQLCRLDCEKIVEILAGWLAKLEARESEQGKAKALDWEAAAVHLKKITENYQALLGQPGVNVDFALGAIMTVQKRYDQGERTQQLHEEIMMME